MGFPAVTAFTVAMLLATMLHWSRFDVRHFPFQLWLGLYVITPFLVPAMWLHNRRSDPGTPEPNDLVVPSIARQAARPLGIALAAIAVASFVAPQLLIQVWPWTLTPLTARVLAGWAALLGVGNLVVAGDTRWSAWRVGVESIALWHLLFLVGAAFNRADFRNASLINWYTLSVVGVLILMAVLYLAKESRRRQSSMPQQRAA
jgi:hypothetical protein